MPAITITDLNNAKTDVDHIAAIATSASLTATDRLGNVKKTLAGKDAEINQGASSILALSTAKANAAAASATEALGYLQAYRATSYGALAADPALDPAGNPMTIGDEYFNTASNLLKRWNGVTWQASDINTANLAAATGSSLIGFQPAPSGTVYSTVQSKGQQIVSLDDFYITATTVSSQVQRAVDSGYSPIHVRAEEWLINAEIVINNKKVSFVSESGSGGTSTKYAKFKLANGANCKMFRLVGDSAYLSLDRMDLDGNKANQTVTTSDAIYMEPATVYTSCFQMRNSFIRNFKGRGIDARENRNSGRVYDGSLIEHNDSEGVYLFSTLDWRFSEAEIGNNGTANNTENVWLDGYTSSVDFTNVDFYYAEKSGLLIGPGVQICTVIGGQVNSNQRHGISIEHGGAYPASNRSIVIQGVVFANNSQQATNTYSDIKNMAPRILVNGCAWHKFPGATILTKYGIDNDSTGVVITSGLNYDPAWFGTAFTTFTNQIRIAVRGMVLGAGSFQRFVEQTGTANVIESYNAGESFPRMRLRNTGSLSAGSGLAEPDITLSRTEENTWTSSGNFQMGTSIGFDQPHLRFGATHLWVGTDGKLRIKTGAPSSDAEGTVVGTQV
jgi:hypothetical protein